MNSGQSGNRLRLTGHVLANAAISSGLIRLDLDLGRPVSFAPGQFAMLNLTGPDSLIFSRPLSILACEETVVSFLYRVVGRGTALLARQEAGCVVTFFGPLGGSFPPPPDDSPVVIMAGGVGLPPLYAWWRRYRRGEDRAYFGGRDGADVPWSLFEEGWRVSVDRLTNLPPGAAAWEGLVVDYGRHELTTSDGPRLVLACGPAPLLRAAARWAAEGNWPCLVSVEERMGCGYGVCNGCVVPLLATGDATDAVLPYATCCEEGPVFAAERIDWDAFARTE